MKLPCPHCGSEDSFYDRSADEIKPIVPVELQGNFDEPPPPISTPGYDNYQAVRPASKPDESHISSNSGSTLQEQIKPRSAVDYKFESTSKKGTIEFDIDTRLESVEGKIKTMENEVKTLSSDMKNMLKSQKVMETILTNMNKKLLKMQKE